MDKVGIMSATLKLQAPVTVGSAGDRKPFRSRLGISRPPAAATVAVGVAATAWFSLPNLGVSARLALVAFGLAVVGWTMTDLDDTFVSLAAAALLVLAGTFVSPRVAEGRGPQGSSDAHRLR